MLGFRTIKCVTLTEDYYYFVATTWPWVDLTVFALLPLVIHIICNVFIVKSVVRSFRQARRSRGIGFAAAARSRTSVDGMKSAAGALTRTTIDGSVGGPSRKSLNDASLGPESPDKDRKLASLNGGSCKPECFSRDKKSARFNGSIRDLECSGKDRKQAGMNDGSCGGPECSNQDRKLASLNGNVCEAECSSKDRQSSHTSSTRKMSQGVLKRGRMSFDGNAEDNAVDVRTYGPVTKDSEISQLGHVQINGLDKSDDSIPRFEGSKQREEQGEAVGELASSNAKFEKNDSRRKNTSTEKDHRRVFITPQPSSAALDNDKSDSQTSSLTTPQNKTQKVNTIGAARKLEEEKSRHKASTQPAENRQKSSAAPNPSSPRDDSRVSSMTVMLVTVSSVFCLTTVPISLYTIINWIMVEKGYHYPYREVCITYLFASLNLEPISLSLQTGIQHTYSH